MAQKTPFTIHIAEQVILAHFCGSEPHLCVSTGNDHVLNSESWDVERVNNVLRNHRQLDIRVHRHVQGVILSHTVWMLNMPHPLLANNINFFSILWRSAHLTINLHSPHKNRKTKNCRNKNPKRFHPSILIHRARSVCLATLLVLQCKVNDEEKCYDKEKDRQRQNRKEERIMLRSEI